MPKKREQDSSSAQESSFPARILNSYRVQIPKNVRDYLKLKEKEQVEITVKRVK